MVEQTPVKRKDAGSTPACTASLKLALRSTAGRRPLEAHIGVQIPESQPSMLPARSTVGHGPLEADMGVQVPRG